MKMNVPIRRVEDYQSEDGRRVQVYTKVGEVETEFVDDEDVEEHLDISKEQVVYMGVLQLQFATSSRDLPFLIPDATSIADAFNKFNDIAKGVTEDVYEKLREEQNQVVPASEMDLGAIENIVGPDGQEFKTE